MSMNHSVKIERLEEIMATRGWLKDATGTQFQRDSVKLYADEELKDLYAYFLRAGVTDVTKMIKMTVTGFSLPTIMIHLWPRENYPVKRFTSLFSGEHFKFITIDQLKEHEQKCHAGWDVHNDGHVGRLVAFLVQNNFHTRPGYWCDPRQPDELRGLPVLEAMKPVNRNRSTTNLHDLQCDLLSIGVTATRPPFKYQNQLLSPDDALFLMDMDVDIHLRGVTAEDAYWEIFIAKAQLIVPFPKEATSFPPHLQEQRLTLLKAMDEEESVAEEEDDDAVDVDGEIAHLLLAKSSNTLAEAQASWNDAFDETREEKPSHVMFKYHDLNREFTHLDQYGPISEFLETLVEVVFKYYDIGGGKVAHERLLKDLRKLTSAYGKSFTVVKGTEAEALHRIVVSLKEAVKKFVHIDHLMNQLSVFLNLYAYPSRWYRFETDSVCILITRRSITFRRIELPDHKVLAECKFSIALPNTDDTAKRAPGQRGVFFKDVAGRTQHARGVTAARIYGMFDQLGSTIAMECDARAEDLAGAVSTPTSKLNQAVFSVLATMFTDVNALVKDGQHGKMYLDEFKKAVYLDHKVKTAWDITWGLLSPKTIFHDNADLNDLWDKIPEAQVPLEIYVNTGWYRFTHTFFTHGNENAPKSVLKVEKLLDNKQQKTLLHVDVETSKLINEESDVKGEDVPVTGTTLGDQFPELKSIIKKVRPSTVSSTPVEDGRQVVPDPVEETVPTESNDVEDELEETPLMTDLEAEKPADADSTTVRSADGTKGVTSTVVRDEDVPPYTGEKAESLSDPLLPNGFVFTDTFGGQGVAKPQQQNILKEREAADQPRPFHAYDPLLQEHMDDARSVWPSMLPPSYAERDASGYYSDRTAKDGHELKAALDEIIGETPEIDAITENLYAAMMEKGRRDAMEGKPRMSAEERHAFMLEQIAKFHANKPGRAEVNQFSNTPKHASEGQERVAPVRSMGESETLFSLRSDELLDRVNRSITTNSNLDVLIERFDKLLSLHMEVRNYRTLDGNRAMLTDSILTTLLSTISSHAGYELKFLDKSGFITQEGRQENATSVVLMLPIGNQLVMVPFVNKGNTETLYCE